MLTTHAGTFEDRTTADSLDVRFRGELVPDRPRPTATTRKIPDLLCEPITPSLNDRIADEIWTRLPFEAHISSKATDRTAIVKSYVDSLSELQVFQAEFRRLISITCEVNLEFRQEKGTTNQARRTKSLADTLDKMIARANVSSKPIQNELTATVAAQPVKLLHRTLTAALKRAVAELASDVEAVLQHMARQRLAGLVEWVAENACRYHFFKEVVIQENEGFKSNSKRGTRSTTDANGNRREQTVQRITSGESGRTIHRWARHEHHVMNAFHTSLANTRVTMPVGAQRVAAAIPVWLRPFVRVIDGDLIRERVIECDYHKEKWSDVTTREVDLPSPPIDQPTFGADPAITIDNFILTGWGPREIAAEEVRRQSDERAACAQTEVTAACRERTVWIFAAVVAVAVSSLLIHSTAPPAMNVLAIALSVYAAINASRHHGRSMGIHGRSEMYVVYAGVAFIAVGAAYGGGLICLGLRNHFNGDVFLGVIIVGLVIAICVMIPPCLRKYFSSRTSREGHAK